MKVRFFLRHGAMVEWPVPQPDQFVFSFFVLNIRSSGFFLADDIYIPGEDITTIGLEGGTSRVVHAAPVAKQ